MHNLTFYCAGSSRALIYTAALLSEAGITFHSCPDRHITHLLLPVPSFGSDGAIRGGGDLQELLKELPKSVTVIGGGLQREELKDYETWDLLTDPWYLARNAGITAHCALELALNKLPVTLEKCPVLVVGWGRIGKCLARLFGALGAEVTVAARKASRRVMAEALGYTSCDIQSICPEKYRLIVNTVPAMILPNVSGTALKIDLASQPGMSGRDILWARGLPDQLAPESSGSLIAQVINHQLEVQ